MREIFKDYLVRVMGTANKKRIKAWVGRNKFDEVDLVFDAYRRTGERGLMIDVGAHWGGSLGAFLQDGWSVLAFEPDPANRAKLERRIGRPVQLTLDPRAAGSEPRSGVSFFTSSVSSGISSLSSFHTSHAPGVLVDITTLDVALAEHGLSDVRFLKVDAEGHDLFVLEGFPWDREAPEVVLCEFENSKTEKLGYNLDDLWLFLEKRGYTVLGSEWFPVIEYGGDHRWKKFETESARISPAACGNLIAYRAGTPIAEALDAAQASRKWHA